MDYSINNPLDKYNKPLNCTDWSKKPPYNSTRRNGDVEWLGNQLDILENNAENSPMN